MLIFPIKNAVKALINMTSAYLKGSNLYNSEILPTKTVIIHTKIGVSLYNNIPRLEPNIKTTLSKKRLCILFRLLSKFE